MLKKLFFISLMTVSVASNASDEFADSERVSSSCNGTWTLTCATPNTCSNFRSSQRGFVTDNGCAVNWGPHVSIGCSNPGYRAVTVGKNGDDRYTEWFFGYTTKGRCPVKAVVHNPNSKVNVFKISIQ